eukprot:gb/GECH01000198.1/.p1 GENE.gb/GECH01000198.1/~~gb/GECH01000198.1/.p1  ORF type:complete len:416 (+),score=82.36 gb/GECH01000198.1/:1-1248(+)
MLRSSASLTKPKRTTYYNSSYSIPLNIINKQLHFQNKNNIQYMNKSNVYSYSTRNYKQLCSSFKNDALLASSLLLQRKITTKTNSRSFSSLNKNIKKNNNTRNTFFQENSQYYFKQARQQRFYNHGVTSTNSQPSMLKKRLKQLSFVILALLLLILAFVGLSVWDSRRVFNELISDQEARGNSCVLQQITNAAVSATVDVLQHPEHRQGIHSVVGEDASAFHIENKMHGITSLRLDYGVMASMRVVPPDVEPDSNGNVLTKHRIRPLHRSTQFSVTIPVTVERSKHEGEMGSGGHSSLPSPSNRDREIIFVGVQLTSHGTPFTSLNGEKLAIVGIGFADPDKQKNAAEMMIKGNKRTTKINSAWRDPSRPTVLFENAPVPGGVATFNRGLLTTSNRNTFLTRIHPKRVTLNQNSN